jgi:folate-binding protein YgfZ
VAGVSSVPLGPSPLLSRPGAVASPAQPELAWHYGDPLGEQRAARRAGVLFDGWARGTVLVSGADRVSWLDNLASQDFAALDEGAASEALWLSPRGHIEHQAHVRVDANEIELRTESVAAAASLTEFLLSRRFRAAVEVRDVSGEVASLDIANGDALSSVTVPRGEFGARASALIGDGHIPAGTWARDALAVAARRPRFGVDNDDRTLPHEMPAWLSAAVALHKGCYCGQETVARIQNIGAPPRRLVLLNLDGSGDVLPATGDDVQTAGGTVVGRVGTVAQHWEDGPIALALVKRTVAPGVPLVAGAVDALIDPDDVPPPGPKRVYDRKQFIDLRRR